MNRPLQEVVAERYHPATRLYFLLVLAGCPSPQAPTPDDTADDTGGIIHTSLPELRAPDGVTAEAPFGQRVELGWDPPDPSTEQLVLTVACTGLKADADGFCPLAELPPSATSYSDHGALSGTTHRYRIAAVRGAELAVREVEVETPPKLEVPIRPTPQGAWDLGADLPVPNTVRVVMPGSSVTPGLLLDAASASSLPSRLSGAGFDVFMDEALSAPGPGELHIRLGLGDDPALDGLFTFEAMGDEGFVLRLVEEAEGASLTIRANTPAGLYRGGMAAVQLLVTEEGTSPRSDLVSAVILDHPDFPVRSVYEGGWSLSDWGDAAELSPSAEAYLDTVSQAGATHLFLAGFSYYPHDTIPWKPWEDVGERIQRIREAAADRFIEVIVEVGKTGPSPWQLPHGYAYVDGLAVFAEPFDLVEQSDGSVAFEAVHPEFELVPDSSMSEPERWELPSNSACQDWTYDPDVGHDSPGSFRLDADGDGGCSQLRVALDPETFRDGRYLLTARVRTDSDAEHLGPYTGSNGQVTLVLRYTDGTSLQLPERSIGIRPDISTVDPTSSNHDGSDWHVLYTTFALETEGREIDTAFLYARSVAGTGTLWMDELSLSRIDGSLRNVVGGAAPPVVTDSEGTIIYEEGVDYEVCQRGVDDDVEREICTGASDDGQYTTVFWPNSPDGTLEWGLESQYSTSLQPFRLRWLDESSRPVDDRVLVTYDINLAYPTQHGATGGDHQSQRYNLCAFDAVFDALDWGDAHARVLGTGAGQLGASSVRIDLSEFRGVNRSHACVEPIETGSGVTYRPLRSNAARFADTANYLIDAARVEDPDVVAYFWDDMLNPMYNGGQAHYQQGYGGPAGATACALGTEYLPTLCAEEDDVDPVDPDAVMIHWSYRDRGIRNTAATAHFYDRTERPWLVGTGGSEQVTADWASIARSSPRALGVSAFYFYEHDIPGSLRAFWNHPWHLRYLVDFESEASSLVQLEAPDLTIRTGTAWATTDGSCGMNTHLNSSNWAGNSDGGLCVEPTTSLEVSVGRSETGEGWLHRAGVFLDGSDTTDETPQLRFVWHLSDGTLVEGAWLDTVEVQTDAARFQRYETSSAGIVSPVDTVGVTVELSAPAGVEAADNLMLWSAPPPCFDACAD